MKKKFITFEAKASKKKGVIEGWANVSERNGRPEIDRDGEVVAYGALENEPVTVPILLQHDWNLPVGKGTVWSKSADGIKGMWIEMELAVDSDSQTLRERAMEAYELVRHGIVGGFSIGFLVKEYGQPQEWQGQRYNVISKLELLETSIVTIPSNRASVPVGVRSTAEQQEAIDWSVYRAAVEGLRQSFDELFTISTERLWAAIQAALRYPAGQLAYQALYRLAPAGAGLDMAKIRKDPSLKRMFRKFVDLMFGYEDVQRVLKHKFDLYTEEEKALVKEILQSERG